MGRKNIKNKEINYRNSIKKSNQISMAKLNQGLTLNQMQLLAYAIYSTQSNGETEFQKHNFQKKFDINQYRTEDALKDSDEISQLRFSTIDLEQEEFSFTNVFNSIKYKKGNFLFKWNSEFLPHILELKDKFVLTDLAITSKFKSGFTWTLYDYLKAHYGHWSKELSKEGLMRLFSVENRKTYQRSTAQLKRGVLDVAIEEINKYTELEAWYTQIKTGNKITGFKLHWSTGKTIAAATDKQINLLREIHDEVEKNILEYLSLKNVEKLDKARHHIISIKDIYKEKRKGLSSQKASELIQKAKLDYLQLETLLEQDGNQRDKSIYYNWLEEDS